MNARLSYYKDIAQASYAYNSISMLQLVISSTNVTAVIVMYNPDFPPARFARNQVVPCALLSLLFSVLKAWISAGGVSDMVDISTSSMVV